MSSVHKECGHKLAHDNFLSAIQHAARLRGRNITTYVCGVCGFIHVGNCRRFQKVRRKVAELEQRLANSSFQAKASPQVIDLTKAILRTIKLEYPELYPPNEP